jgi:dTDP-glucose pyrophosphorylase
LELLSKTAEKVLLVVDNNEKLIGTLADGDLRRHILIDQNLSHSIEHAYNNDPIFIYKEEIETDKIKKLFIEKNISLVPVLDKNKTVLEYITWEKVFKNGRKTKEQKLDAPVVIMAGGKGTRLEPFTQVLPKPLIPVGGKPVINHIIDRFRAFGANEFCITINHMSKIMRAYFDEKPSDYSIVFAEEEIPCGTAGGLTLLADKLNKPFFVTNCDIIIEADYTSIYNYHKKNNNDITLVACTKQYNIPYGVCELDVMGNLAKIDEKPEYNFLVNTGLYILNPNVIDLIPKNRFFHITHLMDKIKANDGSIGVYPVSENAWIDIGQWAEYRKAMKVIEEI